MVRIANTMLHCWMQTRDGFVLRADCKPLYLLASFPSTRIQPIHDEWVWDGSAAKGEGLVASPAVAHDVVYVGSDDGQLVALHQQNGTVKWYGRIC